MVRPALLFAAVAVVLVAGCATPDSKSSPSTAAQRDDKYYHVGSHLPSKEAGRNVNDNLGNKVDVYNDAARRGTPPGSPAQ
jgi:hypothetical protein